MSNKKIFCKQCINPKGMNVINHVTGKDLKFFKLGEDIICEICHEMQTTKSLPSRQRFDQEFNTFLESSKTILFAYSGGLDSTVVLVMLLKECQKRKIKLLSFTVKTTVKGSIAEQNIENVLGFLNLKKNHFYIDITNKIQDDPKILSLVEKPMTTLEVYKKCREKNILPCGKICNAMMDHAYDSVMKDLGFNKMVTGGDTPKKNSNGVYSLFWEKPSGITIIRGGYAFALSKSFNSDYIKNNKIPWIHPKCGGYDTDCLVPGVFFAEGLNHQSKQKPEDIIKKYPIILDYLSERARFGIISYTEALKMLTNVDISSKQSYEELIGIFETANL